MKEYNGKPLVEGLLEEIKYVYKSDKRPWVIGYSGGKDSTVVVHLVYQMLKNLRPEELTQNSLYRLLRYACGKPTD